MANPHPHQLMAFHVPHLFQPKLPWNPESAAGSWVLGEFKGKRDMIEMHIQVHPDQREYTGGCSSLCTSAEYKTQGTQNIWTETMHVSREVSMQFQACIHILSKQMPIRGNFNGGSGYSSFHINSMCWIESWTYYPELISEDMERENNPNYPGGADVRSREADPSSWNQSLIWIPSINHQAAQQESPVLALHDAARQKPACQRQGCKVKSLHSRTNPHQFTIVG